MVVRGELYLLNNKRGGICVKGKILKVSLCIALIMQLGCVAQAEEANVSSAGKATCEVSMTSASAWSVKIPKQLTLDKSTGSCEYSVSCTGDIGYSEIIEIMPQSTFSLTDGSATTLTASVTQDITQFVRNDKTPSSDQALIGSTVKGTVSATSIEPGNWTGSFNFTINSKQQEAAIAYNDVILTATNMSDAGIVASGDVVIPSTYEHDGKYYKIIGLDNTVFANNNAITNVIVPETVTSLGGEAFAFSTNLKSVEFKGAIKDVGFDTFEGCKNLTTVTFADGLTKICVNMFENCKSLKSVSIPKSVTEIAENGFAQCSALTDITFNGPISIGDTAFQNCSSLVNVIWPSSVKSIGAQAFDGCSSLTSASLYNIKTIGSEAFSGCSKLSVLEMSGNVESVGDSAFYGCTALSNITWPLAIKTIGDCAFSNIGITGLTLDMSMETVGIEAFSSCKQLKTVEFVDNDFVLGDAMFMSCTALTSVIIGDSSHCAAIPEDFCDHCTALTDVSIGLGTIEAIYTAAFMDCPKLAYVDYDLNSGNLQTISNNVFYGDTSLSFTIASTVTSIGSGAFENVKQITNHSSYKTGSPWGALSIK